MSSGLQSSSRSLWQILVELLSPWTLLFYVWWFGLHWTVVGLGVVYGVSALITTGVIWERERGR